MMNIVFLGGAETVTGSKYLVETKSTKILIDCGLFQGYKWLRKRNREPLPLDAKNIDGLVLTHAHLDHSGFIPALYQNGFRKKVFTHPSTIALCSILLPDSGHIQEEDANFYTKYKLSKHKKPQPIYTKEVAQKCLSIFKPIDYDEEFQIGDISIRLQDAGHILGAASVIISAEGKTVCFSGDIGRPNDIFMHPPKPLPSVDLLILESTYGDRRHKLQDPFTQLADVINSAVKKGGAILIPSFAVGRAQALQYMLAVLIEEGLIPKLPIFVDSPMAIKVSDIYCQYSEQHRLNKEQCDLMERMNTYVRSTEDSKALADLIMPHIIIAGSGMATGGRVLHHMKRMLNDDRNTLLFSGFLAGGTRGAKLIRGDDHVKIHGQWIPVKANIEVMDGLSAHADFVEITDWLGKSFLEKGTKIKLVHGDPEALEGMCDHLKQNTNYNVEIASYKSITRI